MRAKGEFHTIDPSFFLTKSRQREPQSIETGHRGNGKPTSFTDLTREDLTLEPRRAAMLRRSNFLPYDGVLYEIDDAPDEEDALWSHNGRHHLTYWDYLRIIREEERAKLQSIVVKQLETKSVDYSKSPHRPLQDFFEALVDPHSHQRLQLLIPPTLVQAESSRVLYFTDPATGYVKRLRGDEIEEGVLRRTFLEGARTSTPGTDELLLHSPRQAQRRSLDQPRREGRARFREGRRHATYYHYRACNPALALAPAEVQEDVPAGLFAGHRLRRGARQQYLLAWAEAQAPLFHEDAAMQEVPMAVTKRMSAGKNDIDLLDLNGLLQAFRGQLEGSLVMQKFIKPRGSHAAIYRTTWRRKGPSTTLLVSGMKSMRILPSHVQAKNYFCTNSTDLDSNTVLSFRGKGATETQSLCAAIVDFVENSSGSRCKFDVFVGDFLKDEQEKWYFLQAKSFVCSRT